MRERGASRAGAGRRRAALALALALAGAGLAAQDRPAWYPDPHTRYPDAAFLAFVGEGPDAASAANDALEKLSRYFGVEVKAVTDASQRLVERGDGENRLEQALSNRVSSVAEHRLYNVQTLAAAKLAEGRYAALALIDRADALATWDQLEGATLDGLGKNLGRAESEGVGMVARLLSLRAARVLLARAREAETTRRLLRADAPPLLDSAAAARLDAAENALRPRTAVRVAANGEAAPLAAALAALLDKAGLATGDGGGIRFDAALAFGPAAESYGLSSVAWRLDLALSDDTARVFSLSLGGKAGGSDEAAARAKALRDAAAAAERQLAPALLERLARGLD